MGQGLLAIDMPAGFERRARNRGVYMIRRSANHRLDILLLHHLAEVVIGLRGSQILACAGKVVFIHVAKGNNILAGDVAEVITSLPSNANAPNIQLFIRTITPSKRTLLAQCETDDGKGGGHYEMAA